MKVIISSRTQFICQNSFYLRFSSPHEGSTELMIQDWIGSSIRSVLRLSSIYIWSQNKDGGNISQPFCKRLKKSSEAFSKLQCIVCWRTNSKECVCK